MKSTLPKVPAAALQGVLLLLTFALLMAGTGFVAARPGLAATLVFLFCLPYLAASVATRRAHFLYATMLLGAVAYFMLCYALGAPIAWFPLLSVPLVVCLWVVGQRLKKVLDPSLAPFPRTTFRAMNITVAVFTVWALLQVSGLIGQPGMVRYVAGFTYLGYALLYLTHSLAGAHSLYTYVFCLFLSMGACFTAAAGLSVQYCWVFLLAASGLTDFVGTGFHKDRTLRWSRHFFIGFVIMLIASLAFSFFRWSFVLLDLALGSLLLWQAYRWLAAAVGDVRGASTNERLIPKLLLLGVELLCAPVAVLVLVRPGDLDVAVPAIIAGVTFAWIAWERRREQGSRRNVYVLISAFFLAGGAMGAGDAFAGGQVSMWLLSYGLALFVGIWALYSGMGGSVRSVSRTRTTLAEAAAFPAFFLWYIPLLGGNSRVALLAAALAVVVPAVLGGLLREGQFLCAIGPALCGILLAVAREYGGTAVPLWAVCSAGAALGGVVFLWADARKRGTTKEAALLAWLILTVAAPVFAVGADVATMVYSISVVGAVSILMMAWQKRRLGDRDVFGIHYPGGNVLLTFAAIVATLAVVILSAVSELSLVISGLCLVGLGVAYGVAWGMGRGVWCGHGMAGLFALGAVLTVFGRYISTDARLGAGAAVVLVLFALAASVKRSFPRLADSCTVVGHLTSVTLACAVLFLAWPATGWALVVPAMFYVLLYGVTPRLRANFGFRLGLACWVSFAAVFFLAAARGTAYNQQMLWVAALAAFWMVVGYTFGRGKAEPWSMPMYVGATVVALFACTVSLVAPSVTAGSWQVFLVSGLVFAALFLVIHETIFLYLVTLSLSLMAYDWVRLTTTHFTQDLFFWFLVTVAVLGVYFLFPYLKTIIIRTVKLPLFSIFNWQGTALTVACLAAIGIFVASAYALKATTHPKFCVICHNMDQFYESWQHSSHKDVACLECHYDPGVTGHVKGKMGAMVQVSKYATELRWLSAHAYSPAQPHAIVRNMSCERSECHAGMERDEEELLFGGTIKFRHDTHLGEHPRGKEVNCVSCHGQAVQGEHISVTATTCLTCHFYGRGTRPVAVGDCRTCHPTPGEPSVSGQHTFDHQAFMEGKDQIQCDHCHSQVTDGEAAVSEVRCRSCHVEQMVQTEDQAQFHLIHVSEEHFDCLQCHDRVEHGTRPQTEQLLATDRCGMCHGGDRHTVQEQIYTGIAIPELDTMPDFMYVAGVACSGCHTDVQFVELGEMTFTSKASGAKECAACHADEGYGEMLTAWQEDVRARVGDLEPKVAELDGVFASLQASTDGLAEARDRLSASKTKLSRVVHDGSYGAHNYFYVSSILDSAESDLDACRTLAEQWRSTARQETMQ